MTGRINTFRTAVINTVSQAMPQAKSVEPQFGRFNLDELERESFRCPSIRVAVLTGKVPPTPAGQRDAGLQCAAFIVTDGKERDETGWTMAEAIATILHSGQMFGLVKIGTPENVSIQPVVSASIKNRGVAIIAVEWTQSLRNLGDGIFDGNGVLIEGVYIKGEEVEFPEADDEQP